MHTPLLRRRPLGWDRSSLNAATGGKRKMQAPKYVISWTFQVRNIFQFINLITINMSWSMFGHVRMYLNTTPRRYRWKIKLRNGWASEASEPVMNTSKCQIFLENIHIEANNSTQELNRMWLCLVHQEYYASCGRYTNLEYLFEHVYVRLLHFQALS